MKNQDKAIPQPILPKDPNQTTLAAMREAEASDNLETLDVANFRIYVRSLCTLFED